MLADSVALDLLLRRAGATDWVVYCKPPFGGPDPGYNYKCVNKGHAARVLAAIVLLAELIVLVGLAYLTAFGNVDILAKYIPARFLTPQALLIYMLAGLILLKYGSSDTPELTTVLDTQLRMSNEIAKVDELRVQNARLEQELAVLARERPRSLTNEAIRRISEYLRRWPAFADAPHLRCVTVCASPHAHDAKNYASQIRMALESGQIYSDEVWDFTWGDASDEREAFKEENRRMLLAHEANVTVWGSDLTAHDGEPLDRVLIQALKAGGIDVSHQPGPTSFNGMVAIVVGSGMVTEADREAERLREDIETLRPRRVSVEQQDIVYRRIRTIVPFDQLQRRSVWVIASSEEQEVRAYAHNFMGLFQRIGFQAKGSEWSQQIPIARRLACGLTLYDDDTETPSTRTLLHDALTAAGIVVEIVDATRPTADPETLTFTPAPTAHLVIGYRSM